MLEVRKSVPLAPLTTFQIGGFARHYVAVKTEDEVREAIHWAHERGLRCTILSGGSNVLVSDSGYEGLLIHVQEGSYSFAGKEIAVDAGCNLLELIRIAGRRGLGGWDKLAGIPGSIGGAVRGNAGAFGSEIKDFVHSVRALNMNTGLTRTFTNAECGFQYRNSVFKQHPKWVVLKVYLHLDKINPAENARLIDETIAERERRHLQDVRAAGSYFMNPIAPPEIVAEFEKEKRLISRENRVPAGWLIEKAGMKGAVVGGAISSKQHPNYLVNRDNATAEHVTELAHKIKVAVMSKFGIKLHEEAAIL